MTMTLEFADALQSIRLKYKSSNSIAIERAVITRAEWDAIDAHLTQPAQSVDVEKVREVIAELRANVSPLDGYHSPKFHAWADKLTAALQEKGNG